MRERENGEGRTYVVSENNLFLSPRRSQRDKEVWDKNRNSYRVCTAVTGEKTTDFIHSMRCEPELLPAQERRDIPGIEGTLTAAWTEQAQ